MSIRFNNQKSPLDSIMATDPVTCTLSAIFPRTVHLILLGTERAVTLILYTYFQRRYDIWTDKNRIEESAGPKRC